MRRFIKNILLAGLVILLLLQLFQPARNSDNGELPATHFSKIYSTPPSVNMILETSCFDCHSNNTNYPWYSHIQPVRWWMESHIADGKRELNFSEFGSYSNNRQRKKLKSIMHEINSGDMPLSSYTLIHRDAVITDSEKKVIAQWMNKIQDSLALN